MTSPKPASATAPVPLLGLSFLAALLGLFQWMELLVVRGGGRSVCAISDTVSCEKVWNSAFASKVHALTGLPVAGWGLVWGLAAFALCVLLVFRRLSEKADDDVGAALKLTAAAGVFASLTFAAASFRAGGICLTCAATYAVAFAFAWAVVRAFPGPLVPPMPSARDGLLWAGGATLLAFGLLLYPGLKTPKAGALSFLPSGGETPATGASAPRPTASPALVQLVERLAPGERQLLSDAIHDFRSREPQPAPVPTRFLDGPPNAAIHLVEFTDILCPHCRHFGEALVQLRRSLPPGTLSVEPRQYPLDKECNPNVQHSDQKGVRCLAAKTLICLEGRADFWRIGEALFAEQDNLTSERVLEIAAGASVPRPELLACIAREDTAQKLAQDEEYATQFRIRGTPLVLVNGREAFPSPMFLYALALAGGDSDRLLALDLPPPRARESAP